ncbi:acyl transferase/acyl hydrolase/lysophospholipase, partial [Leptodontidium sp. 2 PMI_412]
IPPRRLRLLSLDGGGVRGLSALLILEQLMHSINHTDPPKPCDHFDLMGGTSTGGLIAIMLGRLRMSVKDCIDAYTTLMDNIFVKQRHRVKIGKDKKLTEPNTWVDVQGKFDDEVLEEAVRTILKKFGYKEDELLKDASPSGCKVFVCATSANRGKPVILSSYFSPNHSIHLLSATTILKAARATSAATSFFNPANISGEIFVDGGLGANNPVNHVFAEAQEVWPELDIRNHLACLISVGTGLTPLTSFDPTDPLGIKDGLVAIATETNETHEKFCKSNQDLQKDPKRFFRFNATGLEDIKMDQPERKEDIQYATYDYFTKGSFSADIRACKK